MLSGYGPLDPSGQCFFISFVVKNILTVTSGVVLCCRHPNQSEYSGPFMSTLAHVGVDP